jgi:hypothetical protein
MTRTVRTSWKRTLLISTGLNAVVWLSVVEFFRWQGNGNGVWVNYGIVAGWGLSLYAASLYRSPILASVPTFALFAAVELWRSTPASIPQPDATLVVLARALVFASPILLNSVVQTFVGRFRASRQEGH